MNGARFSWLCGRAVLALFFFALITSGVVTPLSRAKFNFAPDWRQTHQGISRHTYLEVGIGIPKLPGPYPSFLSGDPPLLTQLREPGPKLAGARMPDNWCIVFAAVYRHIPRSRSRDPDPSAWSVS